MTDLDDIRPRLSGWCQTAPGTAHTQRQHTACERRSRGCSCQLWGGHGNAQVGSVERDSVTYAPVIRGAEGVESGAEKRSPSRVLGGPQPGLLDSNILDERKC